jgi:hypothetical protein
VRRALQLREAAPGDLRPAHNAVVQVRLQEIRGHPRDVIAEALEQTALLALLRPPRRGAGRLSDPLGALEALEAARRCWERASELTRLQGSAGRQCSRRQGEAEQPMAPRDQWFQRRGRGQRTATHSQFSPQPSCAPAATNSRRTAARFASSGCRAPKLQREPNTCARGPRSAPPRFTFSAPQPPHTTFGASIARRGTQRAPPSCTEPRFGVVRPLAAKAPRCSRSGAGASSLRGAAPGARGDLPLRSRRSPARCS